MRGVLPWLLGAVLVFLACSAAFLALANLGTQSREVSLDPPDRQRTTEPLQLGFEDEQLSSLEARPDQRVDLTVRNAGGEDLSDINLVAEVTPEDTSVSESKLYRKTVSGLSSGEEAGVALNLDLSEEPGSGNHPGSEAPRTVIEVRATTPGGLSVVRTVVLSLQGSEAS